MGQVINTSGSPIIGGGGAILSLFIHTLRKSAAASRLREVAAETATRIRQRRLQSKLRGIDILNRVKAERDLRPLLAEKANLFPRTEEVRPHLSYIHILSVQLRDRRMEMSENRALASAEASLLRARSTGTL